MTAHPVGSAAARQGHLLRTVAWAATGRPYSRSGNLARSWNLAIGQAGISPPNGVRDDRRLHGRLAAVFFAGAGVLGLVTLPIPAPGLNVAATTALSLAAMAVGIATWLAPWDKWPRLSSLVLVPLAYTLIALIGVYGGEDLQTYGIFFIVSFAWVGMSQRPGTSVALTPLAATAYALPASLLPGNGAPGLYAAAITIPVCVLVGEGIAWTLRRLQQTELALREERNRAERFSELQEMKDAFILTVSHELRTPITICRGHLDVLEPGAGEREVRAVKETVINVLSFMARLVEDLTTLARLDDGAQLKMETLLLDDFMSGIAQKAEPILGRRLAVEPGVAGASLHADPHRLTQALLNLLQNAADHSQGDSPVLFRVARGSARCRFEVADEGGGLAPGEEQVVFEPFRTGSSSKAGTGLGLSIVRAVARAHGGDSGVVSRPGHGATFWIEIPWSTS